MSILALVGIGVYMIGHGCRGIAGLALAGSVAMIVGGILVVLSALI